MMSLGESHTSEEVILAKKKFGIFWGFGQDTPNYSSNQNFIFLLKGINACKALLNGLEQRIKLRNYFLLLKVF